MKVPSTLCALLAGSFLAISASAQSIWTAGHGDIGIGFDGVDFDPHWHLGEENEPVVVDGVTLQDPEGFEYATGDLIAQIAFGESQTRPTGAEWDFLGVAAGDPVWVFPVTENPAIPFVGFGLEGLDADDWISPITFTLDDVTGSGTTAGGFFSLYDVDGFGAPVVAMTTSGGPAGDYSQDAGTHGHLNIAFSQPGTYAVTFLLSGTHATEGSISGEATYTFQVVPEPTSAVLIGLGLGSLLLRRRR
jgi:surface-anchored protein